MAIHTSVYKVVALRELDSPCLAGCVKRVMSAKIDPARFSSKDFFRKPSWKESKNDYRIMIDGVIAGRIMLTTVAGNKPKWFWTIVGPYLPTELCPGHGAEHTLEQAEEAFKAKFWQWHRWAEKQAVGVTWYV